MPAWCASCGVACVALLLGWLVGQRVWGETNLGLLNKRGLRVEKPRVLYSRLRIRKAVRTVPEILCCSSLRPPARATCRLDARVFARGMAAVLPPATACATAASPGTRATELRQRALEIVPAMAGATESSASAIQASAGATAVAQYDACVQAAAQGAVRAIPMAHAPATLASAVVRVMCWCGAWGAHTIARDVASAREGRAYAWQVSVGPRASACTRQWTRAAARTTVPEGESACH